jgi:hypothetical protein
VGSCPEGGLTRQPWKKAGTPEKLPGYLAARRRGSVQVCLSALLQNFSKISFYFYRYHQRR